jgi:hypothetical protein
VRDRFIVGMMGAVFIALLGGCAARTRPSATAQETEPDCSYRSPTTCWTVSGRFPAARSKPVTAPLDPTRSQSSAVLASEADSAPLSSSHGLRFVSDAGSASVGICGKVRCGGHPGKRGWVGPEFKY